MARTELTKWAQHGAEIAAILEALDALEKSEHLVWESMEQPRVAVARLYDIDLVVLDRERVELLNQARELHEKGSG